MQPGEYELMYRLEESHWWYAALRRVLFDHLDRYLPRWREEPILDAGCGTGSNLQRLGAAAVGVDRCADALRLARTRGARRLVAGDVTCLGFADASFAAVVSTSVLYHAWVADVGAALREFHRVLRPGGWLVLDVPAFPSLRGSHDDAVMTARRFTRAELATLLPAAGFDIRRLTYWNAVFLPAVWILRRRSRSRPGRDFDLSAGPRSVKNVLPDLAMRLEHLWLRRADLPFGTSLSCVAQKRP